MRNSPCPRNKTFFPSSIFRSLPPQRIPLGTVNGMRLAYPKGTMNLRNPFSALCFVLIAIGLAHQTIAAPAVVVSVPDQKLVVIDNGVAGAQFPVSTSKFGLGDRSGSYATPLGFLEIAAKIGANAPMGAVFKNRHMTGEILSPNALARYPIVPRILWLRGLENRNSGPFPQNIYIHGTPVEHLIGRPASYGCIPLRLPQW